MADFVYAGDALAVAQVGTFTIAYTSGASTFTFTINGKSLAVAADTDADTTVTAIVTAWNALTDPEFQEITASNSGSGVLTLTADTAGVPFTVTAAETGAGDGTIGAYTAVTACSGPEWWIAANVKALADGSRALPGAGDTIYFRDSSVNLKYGLETASEAGGVIHFEASYTGQVGLPEANVSGYSEYRARYFNASSSTVYIGSGDGSGSSKIRIASSSAPINIESTDSASDTNGAVEVFLSGECTTTIIISSGSCFVTSTATSGAYSSLTMTGGSLEQDDMILVLEATLRGNSGLLSHGAITTLNVYDSAICEYNLITESITSTAWRVYSGIVRTNCKKDTTVTLLNIGPGGVVDLSRNTSTITLTNTAMTANASLLDPNGILTLSNAIDLGTSGIEDVNINLGKNLDITKG